MRVETWLAHEQLLPPILVTQCKRLSVGRRMRLAAWEGAQGQSQGCRSVPRLTRASAVWSLPRCALRQWIDGFKLTDTDGLREAKLSPRRIVDIVGALQALGSPWRRILCVHAHAAPRSPFVCPPCMFL